VDRQHTGDADVGAEGLAGVVGAEAGVGETDGQAAGASDEQAGGVEVGL
jgi:hypothetical protein